MFVVWLGVALLSASWLFGLGYYHDPDWIAWAVMVSLGAACLLALPRLASDWRQTGWAALCYLPAAVIAPWPYRAAFVLLACGTLAAACPLPRFVTRRAATAAVVGGCLLLIQALAITLYAAMTARNHDLPAPLSSLLGVTARCLGMDAAVHGNTVALHSMRQVQRLGATWELLADPASVCFLVTAVVLLAWLQWTNGRRVSSLARSWGAISLVFAVWLPVRAGVLMSLYLHGILRTDYDAPLHAMRIFWNQPLHLLLLAGPVLLCWRFLPRATVPHDGQSSRAASPREHRTWTCLAWPAATAAGAALLTLGVFWDPVGSRQLGRVIVEEFHPDPEKIWEPTDKPYDTAWYGNRSGYNYYCLYDYCSRFYQMSRLSQRISDAALGRCDVLILKVPTRPYAPPELRSIRRFVERGGGLLLIGEHTNVFRTSDHLNPVARMFGFEFRPDCLFGIDTVFDQHFTRPFVPHPILQQMPALDFATSCSIAPLGSRGRAVIQGRALKSLPADYHSDNYYPVPDDAAEMRYGPFVQLWATRFGRGRVVAFSDSTVFSNFSLFEPGKAELILGMIEWLNHRSRIGDPRRWLLWLGAVLVLGSGFALQRRPRLSVRLRVPWLGMTAAGVLGWSLAVWAVQTCNRAAMPPPQPVRALTQVVIDRTLCDGPLSKSGFISGSEDGFGIFERWILRLGYFTARREGREVFAGDLVVFLHPRKTPAEAFRRRLIEYVANGGRVLIVDSAANPISTTNDLLAPFSVRVNCARAIAGRLKTDAWPEVAVEKAAAVTGGRPFAWIDGQCVGASAEHGRGRVIVVGFGSRFTDAQMGVSGDVVPDEQLRRVFDLQFAVLRELVERQPP